MLFPRVVDSNLLLILFLPRFFGLRFLTLFLRLLTVLIWTVGRFGFHSSIDISVHFAHTLKAIAQSEGISQAELSGQMFRTKGATSVVVDKLVEKGLVVRTREDGNQRRYFLTLTERGWAVHQAHLAYDEAHAAWAAQHLGLSEADLAGVNRSLEQVIQFYSEHYLRSGQPVTPEV